ncbi:methyltransferase domain-containing protein [Streptomyces cadmiisoli]|uniref:methyltransferase domain-containing protein n=1 Tax=Streptomyces cadmiisoli TaxID=2184053 RepID=UPI0036482C6C
MTLTEGHLLEIGQSSASARFDALATLFDPMTLRHIEDFGIGLGWRCWEVGAGGRSLVPWLAKKVGPTGKVVATDVDTSWVTTLARPPIEVRVHDVAAQEPPGERFDLVHARLVLSHVPDPERALRSMVRALRPGGRLLVEETDLGLQPLVCPDECGPEEQLANRLRKGMGRLLVGRGIDVAHGRRLPRLLREFGLRRVEAGTHFPMATPACAALESVTIERLRDQLIAAGYASERAIDRHLANIAVGTMDLAAVPMVSAWGRKP